MDTTRISTALQTGLSGLRDSQDSRSSKATADNPTDRQRGTDSGRSSSSALAKEGGQVGQSIDGLGDRGNGHGAADTRQDEAALVRQAMALLSQLAELDPHNRKIQQRARNAPATPSEASENLEAASTPEDPLELFALFARELHGALLRLALLRRSAGGEQLQAIDNLQSAQSSIQSAAAWWQARTLARGRAEAQLQELKLFLESLCSRGSGLAVLMALVETRGQAIRSLLGEVDVLRRILERAVKEARAVVGKRHAGTLSKLEAGMRFMSRAEQSIDIINHLENQLRGTKVTPAPPGLIEPREVLVELRRLQSQLEFFRAAGAVSDGSTHLYQLGDVASAITRILDWHELPSGTRPEWERLDAICGLLVVRLRSAASWVDKNALQAIVNDLREAIRLAVESCEHNENAPAIRARPSTTLPTIDDLARGIRFTKPRRLLASGHNEGRPTNGPPGDI